MTFLAPAFLIAAAAIAAGVVALHFIVTREPPATPLPTARFAPARPVRARPQAMQPQDLLLMALRIAIIFCVGGALARPVPQPPRRALARILLLDRSGAVASPEEAMDSLRRLYSSGDAVVSFDTVATVHRGSDLTSAARPVSHPARGRLTTALVAGLRAASAMRATADSLEMVVVSPLASEAFDEATDPVRALWPGAIRLVRIAPRTDASFARTVILDGAADDPLRLALTGAAGATPIAPTVRIARGSLGAADSAWLRDGARVIVHWPDDASLLRVPLGDRWARRDVPDTVGAVAAGGIVVVAPFIRALRSDAGAGARVVARWVDGEPAAIETAYGRGCVRTVAIGFSPHGDLVLQPRFARFVGVLGEPCGGARSLSPPDAARLATLAGASSPARVVSAALAPPETRPTPLAAWLLAAALLLAAGEMLARRRRKRAAASGSP